MPQVKEPLIRTLVKEALQEAEASFGKDNTKFKISVDVGNPQSETKLGLRIKLRPLEGFLEPDKKGELEAAIMTKMNNSLEQFNIQVSKDTDVPDPEVMGFFIPLPQLKNMIISALGGTSPEEKPTDKPNTLPTDKVAPTSPTPSKLTDKPTDKPAEPIAEQDEDPLDRAARLAKEPLPAMSKMTGLGMKRSQYEEEEGGKLSLKELYETSVTVKDGMLTMWHDIVNDSDYKFKEYLENNEDQWVRSGAIVSMIVDELADRLEVEEPVGPDQGIEELKNTIKKLVKEQSEPLNEVMRQKMLNEISSMVLKEDFYGFINAGNNMLRTLEERFEMREAKKYLEYLVRNNIM